MLAHVPHNMPIQMVHQRVSDTFASRLTAAKLMAVLHGAGICSCPGKCSALARRAAVKALRPGALGTAHLVLLFNLQGNRKPVSCMATFSIST